MFGKDDLQAMTEKVFGECRRFLEAEKIWIKRQSMVNEGIGIKLVIMACDEVFSHLRPIFITVEPVSSLILRIELADSREVSVWKEHLECIERNGYVAVYLVNDEDKSMSVAQKEVLADVIRQSDTFHGLAHRLGARSTRKRRKKQRRQSKSTIVFTTCISAR